MTKCVFCGRDESPYKGVHLIKNDGNTDFFCSSKCRRNSLNLGRDKKKMKWTAFYTEVKEKAAAKAALAEKTEVNVGMKEEIPGKTEKKEEKKNKR